MPPFVTVVTRQPQPQPQPRLIEMCVVMMKIVLIAMVLFSAAPPVHNVVALGLHSQQDPAPVRPQILPSSFAVQSASIADVPVEIRHASAEKGMGVFASREISLGTYLGAYTGEIMTRNEVRARYWNKRSKDVADTAWEQSRTVRNQGLTGDYVMELSGAPYDPQHDEKDDDDKTTTNEEEEKEKDRITTTYYVCAEDSDLSTWTRFMNHHHEDHGRCCNVKAFTQSEINGETHRYPRFYTIRDIHAGEELLYSYGDHFFSK